MSTQNESTENKLPPQDGKENTEALKRAQYNQGDNVRASWKFSLDTVRKNIAYMSPAAKDLLVWAFTWCIDGDHPVHFSEFCDRLGYSENTLYKAYSGKLVHPTEKRLMDLSEGIVRALQNFRRMELSRAKLGRKRFVETETARRVFYACDISRESQTPVFVMGASHIGKTEAFREYCIRNNHGKSVLVELEGISGLMGIIRAIAGRLGISPKGNTPQLVERIKRALTRDMVLVLDEVHLLANTYSKHSFLICMETIRRIYDATQCGLVMSFTEHGYRKADERKEALEQIFRRGVHRVNLGDRPTTRDVKSIIKSWGLDFPAQREELRLTFGRESVVENPFKMLEELSARHGLKAIVERLRYGSKFAADAGSELTWEFVVLAHLTIAKAAQAPKHGWGEG